MTNKYFKICSASLPLRGIQNTTSLGSYLTPVRMAIVQCLQRTSTCDVTTPSPADRDSASLKHLFRCLSNKWPCADFMVRTKSLKSSEEGFSGLGSLSEVPAVSPLFGLLFFNARCLAHILFFSAVCGPLLDFPMAQILMFSSSVSSMLGLVENPEE